jgi:hypothetical protein
MSAHTNTLGSSQRALFLPSAGEFLRYRRLRDWLRLLSFEVEDGRFGCYRLPVASMKWLARCAWMERVGDRWWPVFGAVYLLTAVKRVRGMRLIGTVWKQSEERARRLTPVATTRVALTTGEAHSAIIVSDEGAANEARARARRR